MIGFRMGTIEFEDALVEEKIDQAKARGARRIGFLTREAAMASIVPGAGPSRPGEPPHSHVGTLSRFIAYDYDPTTSTMVAGPKHLSRRSQDAPEATEQGGRATTVYGRQITVDARPFMRPAFSNVLNADLPEAFANTFR